MTKQKRSFSQDEIFWLEGHGFIPQQYNKFLFIRRIKKNDIQVYKHHLDGNYLCEISDNCLDIKYCASGETMMSAINYAMDEYISRTKIFALNGYQIDCLKREFNGNKEERKSPNDYFPMDKTEVSLLQIATFLECFLQELQQEKHQKDIKDLVSFRKFTWLYATYVFDSIKHAKNIMKG